MEPRISIIIPIYNAEKFLPECLDSVLYQDFPSFELLLIDDGSTDASGEIADRYATKDSRIAVVHQPNAGVSEARNRGLALARGEYITFIDADDRVSPTYLSHFLLFESDLAIAGILLLYDNSGKEESYGFDRTRSARSKPEQGNLFAEAEMHNTTKGPCNKLFRRDIIQENLLHFDPRYSYGEDHLFVLNYVKQCRSIALIDHIDYYYIQRDTDSLTHRLLPYKALSAYAREAYALRQELIGLFGIDNREYERCILEERAHLIYQSIYALYSAEGHFPSRERWEFIEEVYRQDYDMVVTATRLPLIFRLMKIALRWKKRPLTDGTLLLLSRGKEWIKKHI